MTLRTAAQMHNNKELNLLDIWVIKKAVSINVASISLSIINTVYRLSTVWRFLGGRNRKLRRKPVGCSDPTWFQVAHWFLLDIQAIEIAAST